jgi:hypothetical protein
VIAHIVLLRTKPGLSSEERLLFAQTFERACRSLPSIRRVRVGLVNVQNSSGRPEIGDKPYEVAAVLEFDGPAGLNHYLKDPGHTELARIFWQFCESTLIVDAEMGDPSQTSVASIFGLKT